MTDDTPAPPSSPLEALARALQRAGEKYGDRRLVEQGEELQGRVDSGRSQSEPGEVLDGERDRK
jgi:hypothetical protein